jgi:SAM-dependent methyltransferase
MNDSREDDLDRIRSTYERYDVERHGLWDLRNSGYARLARERDALLVDLLRESVPEDGRVLDLGCGDGYLAGAATSHGLVADWTGVDIRADALDKARREYPSAEFIQASADAVPAADGSFHVVLASNLFSSLPSSELVAGVAREIKRLLSPGGWLLWYDMRYPSPRNPEVHPLTKRAVESLFPGWRSELRTFTLLPPVARRLGPSTPYIYPVLHAIPMLRSHLIGRLRAEAA